jgi:transcriptional regulator with XRE-family HTH domain
MERRTVARALRAIRRRKRWTQTQLGARLHTSKSEISRWERGALDSCTVEEVERWSTALGAHLGLELRTGGARPLTDARHARIQSWPVTLLRESGWMAEPEVSFNHFGDRGRIDVLACHATSATMLVVEIKTRLDDARTRSGDSTSSVGWPQKRQ